MPGQLRCLLMVSVVLSTVTCSGDTAGPCTGEDPRLVESGTLTVAADYSYPPFAFRSPDNDLIGFDVDVVNAVGKELKLDVRFVNRGTGALVSGALAHRHDVAVSGLRGTEKLRSEACVSAAYLPADLGLLVADPGPDVAPATASDLDGKTVAVLDGSRAEAWANENLGSSTVAALPTTDDLLTAIQQKQADAVVVDLAVARFAATQSKEFRVAETIETKESYVFATSPDNGALIERVDGALRALARKGKMAEIRRKWFGS